MEYVALLSVFSVAESKKYEPLVLTETVPVGI